MAPAATLLALLALLSCAAPAASQPLANPTVDPAACGRDQGSWLCDPSGLLSPSGAAAVDALLARIRDAGGRFAPAPPCAAGSGPAGSPPAPDANAPRGWELAVAVVERAPGAGPAAERARAAARAAHDAWGLGDACGSGALLLVATADRSLHLSTGEAARAALPDGRLEAVFGAMRPLLRAGDVDAAVLAGVAAAAHILSTPPPPRLEQWSGALLVGGLLAAVALRGWWEGRGARARRAAVRRRLTALEAAAAAAAAQRYAATSCPVCLDDFAAAAEATAAAADGGAAGSGAAAAGAAPPPPPGLARELLRCGHAFCGPCLARAVAANPVCPVCRAPVDGTPAATVGASAPAPAPPPPPFEPEFQFRLRSLQRAYPAELPDGLVRRWAVRPPAPAALSRGGGGAPPPARSLVGDWGAELARSDRAAAAGGRRGGRGGGGGGGGPAPAFGGGSSRNGGGGGSSW